jgi:hypothetical protein
MMEPVNSFAGSPNSSAQSIIIGRGKCRAGCQTDAIDTERTNVGPITSLDRERKYVDCDEKE